MIESPSSLPRGIKGATILAIETATSSCSAALCVHGEIFELREIGKNVHSQVLLQMVEQLLEQANVTVSDLDAVAVGQGPGSFTGLRIGVGVAQGLAYGAGCPMIGISSLDALANQAEFDGHIIAALDARMGEVYWCEYQKDKRGLTRLSSLHVTPPEQVLTTTSERYQLLGNAWEEYADSFAVELMRCGSVNEMQVYPAADALLELAKVAFVNNELVSPVDFMPEYVRNDVAKKSTKTML